ncbi:hypothetical protein diail_3335 [Diaporthe ilicicola]|nr:hypothetical protein diail_3335 [Diaporthe ilicicola]
MSVASALSPEVQWMRRRVRHIHIPDLPPLYAPRSFAGNIRDHIQGQIIRQRALAAEDQPPNNVKYGFAKVPSAFTSWLEQAGPPPTVLSFTRRPTYILPKHQVVKQEPWQVEYLTRALKSRMNIHFPEPPRWSSLPWRPSWEANVQESELKYDPLNHQWTDVGVLIMPCAEAMFLGPGQVSIWPIIDLKDEIQRGDARMRTKYEYERILEDTTIEILRREFHISAFAIPGSPGVWVESRIPPPEVNLEPVEAADVTDRPEQPLSSKRRVNVRRIATVHASITNDITQWGVSIHVGQPDPALDSWTSSTNPWTPIRQHNITTSIAAELSFMNISAGPLGPSRYLQTHFDRNSAPARAGQGAVPYSLIKAGFGRRSAAPMGMDNRDISTAWTYEFARQLGMKDGHVDHYSVVDTDDIDATVLPTKSSGPGFSFHGVYQEDVMNRTYRQVDVHQMVPKMERELAPEITRESTGVEQPGGRFLDSIYHDRSLLSWSVWKGTLTRTLDEAICGGPADTRLKAYEMQKQVASNLQRRRNNLQQAKKVEEEWGARMPNLIRRPLTDSIIIDVAETAREMERILKTVRIGKKSQVLLHSTIQLRRLLERHFAGTLGRNEELSSLEEAISHASSPASSDTATLEGTEHSLKQGQPTYPDEVSSGAPIHSAVARVQDEFNLLVQPDARSNLATVRQGKISKKTSKGVATSEGKHGIGGLQPDSKNGIIPRSREWFDFTETNTSKYERRLEERMRKREERRAARMQAPQPISQFLPNTQQIGGS